LFSCASTRERGDPPARPRSFIYVYRLARPAKDAHYLVKMMTPMRYLFVLFGIIVCLIATAQKHSCWHSLYFKQITLHYILTFSHEEYGKRTSLSKLINKNSPQQHVDHTHDDHAKAPPVGPSKPRKAKAAFVILARNGDLQGVLKSMKQMEDRFNKKFDYPYVFLNEEPFSAEFKKYVRYLHC
jgi:alpha 1,2-mannosyltransferase